jgi:hypothetical protein
MIACDASFYLKISIQRAMDVFHFLLRFWRTTSLFTITGTDKVAPKDIKAHSTMLCGGETVICLH